MSNEKEFKDGDTVRLKSGGPLMTVAYAVYGTMVPVYTVVWMNSNGEVQTANVPSSVLASSEPLH